MERAREKILTKHISAVVSQLDYDFLKSQANQNNMSMGDMIRLCIHEKYGHILSELENKRNEEQQERKQSLFYIHGTD